MLSISTAAFAFSASPAAQLRVTPRSAGALMATPDEFTIAVLGDLHVRAATPPNEACFKHPGMGLTGERISSADGPA